MTIPISWLEEKEGIIQRIYYYYAYIKTDCVVNDLIFYRNACLYDGATAEWSCAGDFHFTYVFPLCGMYKKGDGKELC